MNSIQEGDQGGPATYNFYGKQFLGGIAAFDLPPQMDVLQNMFESMALLIGF